MSSWVFSHILKRFLVVTCVALSGVILYLLIFYDPFGSSYNPIEPEGKHYAREETKLEVVQIVIPRSPLLVPTPDSIPIVNAIGEPLDTSAHLELSSRVPVTVTVSISPGYYSVQIPPEGTRVLRLPPGIYKMTYTAPGYGESTIIDTLRTGYKGFEFFLIRF